MGIVASSAESFSRETTPLAGRGTTGPGAPVWFNDGLQISSVSTSGNNVTINFPSPQYTNLEEIAGVGIVPASIWSKVSNPATYTDPTPVGTGPFELSSFTPQGFTLKENPNYWDKIYLGFQGSGFSWRQY